MIEQGFIDTKSSPRFNLLTYPWYANIMILPGFVKRRLAELYRFYQNKYKENVHIYNGFKMIIYNLTVGEENKGGIREFIEANDKVDKVRDEKLTDAIPELKEVYEWAQED
jgi:stalled ribosome rescue protein Dom34